MDNHIFKPGDMAIIREGVCPMEITGMHCIVESHPYINTVFRFDGAPYNIDCVDITIGYPRICKANVNCLKYVPPDEWPKSEYKQRELVRVEGVSHESDTTKRRELATTE